MPYQASGINMFPGFSIVSGSKNASVDADENCTSGSFKSAAYSWLLKIFEYRRPNARSVCCFQIYTPVIAGKYLIICKEAISPDTLFPQIFRQPFADVL